MHLKVEYKGIWLRLFGVMKIVWIQKRPKEWSRGRWGINSGEKYKESERPKETEEWCKSECTKIVNILQHLWIWNKFQFNFNQCRKYWILCKNFIHNQSTMLNIKVELHDLFDAKVFMVCLQLIFDLYKTAWQNEYELNRITKKKTRSFVQKWKSL